MNPGFWEGKRVLLTGHTGFKGSWLSLWLQKAGARLVGYSLPAPTVPSLFEVARVAGGMTSVEGDIRDLPHLAAVLRQHEPEIVIHMAAQSLVRYSYEHPVETYMTNVIGTVNVFEAVRAMPGVRTVLNITSDKCYENREWHWGYRENEPMGGYDPYSSSKGCAELVTAAYRNSYFSASNQRVVLASARAGNVIGGGDWAKDRLIPDIVQAFMQGRPAIIRNPVAIRPWQHVLEPLNGYLTLVEASYERGVAMGEGWNFGPESADVQPVAWIVERMAQMWGGDSTWKLDPSEQPHEARHLKLDCSKAQSVLGWRPKMTLAEGLARVVDWYRAFQNGQDMRDYTMNEIAVYEKK
ncbi:MAG: CDP-glucose 4,6-dehydratase [Gammaproteobacteria bacterium]|nr:CDP-glucose 4,6-dehydratase [Gammaproteobacteria bacterium]